MLLQNNHLFKEIIVLGIYGHVVTAVCRTKSRRDHFADAYCDVYTWPGTTDSTLQSDSEI